MSVVDMFFLLLYMQKFLRREIFAEQQVNRIFAITFSRITGPKFSRFSWVIVLSHNHKTFNLLF